MSTDYPIVLNPICVEFIEKTQNSDYYPFSDDGKNINYRKCALYLQARGYLYDIFSQDFFKLECDGLYYSVPEEDIVTELYSLIYFHNLNFNAEPRHINSIVGVFKGICTSSTLSEKFMEFLKTSDLGMDYEIGYNDEMMGYHMIQLTNGIFNPCAESGDYPFKLLPHNGLYFPSQGSKPYNLEFYPIPESDLFSIPICDDFLKILGDKRTLECFLWWSGAVLFSKPYRLPVFVLLYGPGGTGKDSLSGCLSSILGEMSGNVPLSEFGDPRNIAPLIGKKLNISSEMEGAYDKGLLKSIKSMTGGTKIHVNPKFKQPRDIDPPALLFTGNVFPDIDTSDTGIMRRVHVYDCSADLVNDGIDWPILMRDNDHKNWLFNASYYYWRKYRDMPPDKMKSESMRKMESRFNLFNPLSSWIFEKFGTLERAIIRKKLIRSTLTELYDEYCLFVNEARGKPLGRLRFSEKLQTDYGLKLAPIGSTRVFKLKEEA